MIQAKVLFHLERNLDALRRRHRLEMCDGGNDHLGDTGAPFDGDHDRTGTSLDTLMASGFVLVPPERFVRNDQARLGLRKRH